MGSWRTLFDFKPEGADSFHRGDVVEIEGSGNVLCAEGGVVAVVGVDDLIVVHTPDATMVCPRESAQRVRDLVDTLKGQQKGDVL